MRFLRSGVVVEVSIWCQIWIPEVDLSLSSASSASILGLDEMALLVEGVSRFLQAVVLRCFAACSGVLRGVPC